MVLLAKMLLENAHGNDPIEKMELKILKLEEEINELETLLLDMKDEVYLEIFKEKLNSNDPMYEIDLYIENLAKKRLYKIKDFAEGAKKLEDFKLTIKLGKIQIDQMKREFQANLLMLQEVNKLRATKILKRLTDDKELDSFFNSLNKDDTPLKGYQ